MPPDEDPREGLPPSTYGEGPPVWLDPTPPHPWNPPSPPAWPPRGIGGFPPLPDSFPPDSYEDPFPHSPPPPGTIRLPPSQLPTSDIEDVFSALERRRLIEEWVDLIDKIGRIDEDGWLDTVGLAKRKEIEKARVDWFALLSPHARAGVMPQKIRQEFRRMLQGFLDCPITLLQFINWLGEKTLTPLADKIAELRPQAEYDPAVAALIADLERDIQNFSEAMENANIPRDG